MNEIKALILCNNPIAIPGIREFLFYGKIAAIATTKRNKEMQHILQALVEGTGVPLFFLDKKNYEEQLTEIIMQHQVNAVLLMTFPFLIRKKMLQIPAKGFINFHYGLLPQCRGPHPIIWHLLNNDKESGVTVHQVDEGIDTGPIIIQEKVQITENDTYGLLQTKLAYTGARLAEQLLKILSYGRMIPATPQDETKAKYYKMPVAKELTINWQQMSAASIIRMINACNPWNKGAGTSFQQWIFGITEAEDIGVNTESAEEPGTVLCCNREEGLIIKTSDNRQLRVNIVYTSEGFFSGARLAEFGIRKGVILG
jgi:methionyl-tRNA formyltransferase